MAVTFGGAMLLEMEATEPGAFSGDLDHGRSLGRRRCHDRCRCCKAPRTGKRRCLQRLRVAWLRRYEAR